MSSEISKLKYSFLSKREIIAIDSFFTKSCWQIACEFSSGVLIEEMPGKGFTGFLRSLLSKKRYLLLIRQKPETSEWLVFFDLGDAKKKIIGIIKEAESLAEIDSSFLLTTANPSERFQEISDHRIDRILSKSVDFDHRIHDLMVENSNLLTLRGQIDAPIKIEWAVARVFKEASTPLPEISAETMSFISSLSVPMKSIRSIAVEQFVLLINQEKVDSVDGAIRHVGTSLDKIEDYIKKTFCTSEAVSNCLQEQIVKYLNSFVNGSRSFLKVAGRILSENFDDSEDKLEIIRECLFKSYVSFFREKFRDIQQTRAWTVLSKNPFPTPLSNAGEQYFYELLDDSFCTESRGQFRFPTLIIRTDYLNVEFSPRGLLIKDSASQREGSYSDVSLDFNSLLVSQFALNKRGKHQTGIKRWRYLKKDLTKNLRYKNNEYVDIYEFCAVEIRLRSKMIAYMIVDGILEGVKKLFSEFLEELKIISDFLNGRSEEKHDTNYDIKIQKTIPNSPVKEESLDKREEKREASECVYEETSEYLKEILGTIQKHRDESSNTETTANRKNQDLENVHDRLAEEPGNNHNYREKLISRFNELSSKDFKTHDYADLSESALITLLLFELASSDLSTRALDKMASFREVLKEEHDSLFRNVLDSTYSKLFLSSNLISSVTFSDRVKLLLKEYPLGKDLLDSIINNEAELFVRNYEASLVKLPLVDAVEQELRSVSNLLSISDEPRKTFEESLLQRILRSLDNSMKGNRTLLSSIKTLTSDPSDSWIKRKIIEYFESQPMVVRESNPNNRRSDDAEEQIAEINLGANSNIISICISESNEVVYSALSNGSITSTNLSADTLLRTVSSQESEGISVIAFAEEFLISGHENGVVRIWSQDLSRPLTDIAKTSSKIIGLSYSVLTRTLISCSETGEIRNYAFSNGSFVELKAPKQIDCQQNIETFYMDWEDERIIVGAAKKICGYSPTGETLFNLEMDSSVSSIIRTHSEEFAVGTEDGSLLFLDLRKQRILARRKIYFSPLRLHLDSDKRNLICTCKEGRVLIIDLDSRKVFKTIYVDSPELSCSETVSDGGTILFGTGDGSLLLLERAVSKQMTDNLQINDHPFNGNHVIQDEPLIVPRINNDPEPAFSNSFNHIPYAKIYSEEDQTDLETRLRHTNEDDHSIDSLKSALESFSSEEKRIIKSVIKLDRNTEYPLSNLRINQLQLMRVMSKLSCDGRPLIEIVERDSRYVIWGRGLSTVLCSEISAFVLSERAVDNGQEDGEALQKDIQ